MKIWAFAAMALLGLGSTVLAQGPACPNTALGTARTLAVPVSTGPVGGISYKGRLPLEKGEVVITFDDGPMPRRTPAVLDALKHECVRATFFVVGRMVQNYPELLQRVADDGHTIASHSWSHAYLNRVRSAQRRKDEINGGLLATSAALGANHPALSPFFRYPGLGRTRALERYVAGQNLIAMSADIVGDDWLPVSAEQVHARVLARLKARGSGIILLHDIQKRTVDALPGLLRALKHEGYRVVHIVPEAADVQLALAKAEPPASARIRVALASLERRQGSFAELTVAKAAPMPQAPHTGLLVMAANGPAPGFADLALRR